MLYTLYTPMTKEHLCFDDQRIIFRNKEEIQDFKNKNREFMRNAPGIFVTQETTPEELEKISGPLPGYTFYEDIKEFFDDVDDKEPPYLEREDIYNLLKEEFSPEKTASYMPTVLAAKMIDQGLIRSFTDFNFLALEALQKAYKDDDEFPIYYYLPDEEMHPDGRIVKDIGEQLTDDYIAENFL